VADGKDIDLSAFSVAELRKLCQRVEDELDERREEGRRWLRQHGLVEKRIRMYRNPRNARETWNGRGELPDWVKEALDQGHTLESLAANSGGNRDLPIPSRRGSD
jgi:HPt (histidine-containing phosphotransfer) domain-containing protein